MLFCIAANMFERNMESMRYRAGKVCAVALYFAALPLGAVAQEPPVVNWGTPEVVEEGVSGLLSPVGDVAQMTANALRILGDPAVHVRYAEGALQIAAKFDLIRILPLYENLYTEVVERMKANGVHQRSR